MAHVLEDQTDLESEGTQQGQWNEVEAIMKNVVTKSSLMQYQNKNIWFFLWLFGNCNNLQDPLLENWFIAAMNTANLIAIALMVTCSK